MRTVIGLLVVVACSACASAPKYHRIRSRAEREWARQDRTEQFIELAKRHPNAVPRERPLYPEFAPGEPKRVGKPWL